MFNISVSYVSGNACRQNIQNVFQLLGIRSKICMSGSNEKSSYTATFVFKLELIIKRWLKMGT